MLSMTARGLTLIAGLVWDQRTAEYLVGAEIFGAVMVT